MASFFVFYFKSDLHLLSYKTSRKNACVFCLFRKNPAFTYLGLFFPSAL